MKRDMTLVREIFLGVEANSDGSSPFVLDIDTRLRRSRTTSRSWPTADY